MDKLSQRNSTVHAVGLIRNQIEAMKYFRGHSSEESSPPPNSVIAQARCFTTQLFHAPFDLLKTISVFPTGRESIQFERTPAEDVYYEVEIFVDKVVCYSDTFTSDEGVTMPLKEAVDWFIAEAT